VIASLAKLATILAQEAEQTEEPVEHLSPQLQELVVGALAFAVLFFFMWKWVLPRINQTLESRRQKIQGDLENAEEAKNEARKLLADYREQLSGARDEANRIIEEARKTAEQLRRDQEQKAEQEYQAIVGRAQEEIRAERDRVFQELRTQVGVLSVELAGRVVGAELDRERHLRLVDDYIRELGGLAPSGNGHGAPGSSSPGSSSES
jgi:F-type H+-transporting ATPase subunit b